MNEIERIKRDGLLPDVFFKPEYICDFYVDETRKKVWAVMLDMMSKFSAVCKKHNLSWYLVAGSLLGAVRHKGFVPWDDDLDIALSRSDYEKLLTLSYEFKDPYFLQTPYTDHGYYYSHAKLRNSNTSAIDYPFWYQGFNMGIFIDIHPMDIFDKTPEAVDLFNKQTNLIISNSIAMRLTHPNLSERDKKRVADYIGDDPLETFRLINKNAQFFNGKKTDYLAIAVVTTYGFERCVYAAADFKEIIPIDFHGLTAYVPVGYDNVLKTIYGNYLEYPPIEERGTWHGNLVFNPEKSYIEELKDKGVIKW